MLVIFESIVPVFLLILLGGMLRRAPLIDAGAWPGLEQLGYWFLYPALLFVTILHADFSGVSLDRMMATLLLSLLVMCSGTLALWPLLVRLDHVSPAEFSSVFQTTIRWNAFVALAIAHKTFPPEGTAVVALAMAVIIIPINIVSVFVVTCFADRSMDWPKLLRALATNPLILPCLAAIVARALPFDLYEPFDQTLQLAGQAALGLALLSIGAGLSVGALPRRPVPLVLPLLLKLLVFPLVLIAIGLALGVTGADLVYLTLIAAVPTAANGFLLARQLGGDTQLYAAVTTTQTAASCVSIPAMLWLAAQLGGG